MCSPHEGHHHEERESSCSACLDGHACGYLTLGKARGETMVWESLHAKWACTDARMSRRCTQVSKCRTSECTEAVLEQA